jgi:hypothetical protein
VKKLLVLALFGGMVLWAFAVPASAQTIPNVRGLSPFTAETNFMSRTGYLRWQYYAENNVWLSRAEASSLAQSQTGASTASAVTQ